MLSLCLILYPVFYSRHVIINNVQFMNWKYDASALFSGLLLYSCSVSVKMLGNDVTK